MSIVSISEKFFRRLLPVKEVTDPRTPRWLCLQIGDFQPLSQTIFKGINWKLTKVRMPTRVDFLAKRTQENRKITYLGAHIPLLWDPWVRMRTCCLTKWKQKCMKLCMRVATNLPSTSAIQTKLIHPRTLALGQVQIRGTGGDILVRGGTSPPIGAFRKLCW
jgi:hypothetical protein